MAKIQSITVFVFGAILGGAVTLISMGILAFLAGGPSIRDLFGYGDDLALIAGSASFLSGLCGGFIASIVSKKNGPVVGLVASILGGYPVYLAGGDFGGAFSLVLAIAMTMIIPGGLLGGVLGAQYKHGKVSKLNRRHPGNIGSEQPWEDEVFPDK